MALLSVGLFVFLAKESTPFLFSSPQVTGNQWHPTEGTFGFFPLLVGSFLTAIFSTLFSLPFAFAFARILLLARRPMVRESLRVLLETLSGLPSIIVGLWGLTFLVPKIAAVSGAGVSLFASVFILIVMVTPLLSLAFYSTFEQKMKDIATPGHALGLNDDVILRRIVVPSSLRSLASQSYLGLGRALGETMAVLLVCGNIVQIPHSIFDSVRTLNTNIALEVAYATGVHRSSLFCGGLLMLIFSTALLFTSYKVRANEAN